MTRMIVLVAVFLMTGVVQLAYAGAGTLDLAVYGNGRVLVCEVRSLSLPADGEVVFSGVPETVLPDTLSVRSLTAPDRFRVLEIGYRFDRADASTLFRRYRGREVTVILPDPRDANGRISRKAVLLDAGGTPVFDLGDSIYVGPFEGILLPELPEGLDREPTLRWLVENRGPARQDVEVSYLADGMGWRADYALILDEQGKNAALSAWATIDNQTGMDFPEAGIKLVAGEVNRVSPQMRQAKSEAYMTMDAVPGPQERAVGEYHLYELSRPVSLSRAESRQVRLFSAPKVPVRSELISRFTVWAGQQGRPIEQPVEAFLEFENDGKSGLGQAMPAGTARVYRREVEGAALLLGEDQVGHVPDGEKVRLKLGNAFDVTVERVQTAFRKIGKTAVSMTWEITVRNGSKVEKRVKLQEMLNGQWSISKATMKYEKVSSGMVEFELVLPPGKGATTLSYSVDIS
ncbi:MAG: DUF4139 domain-containing protein [Proteobacteria bacterium]|nr:DUF4139 domain-containing protein [Pseudomonadota bacterium]MBU1612516.1 DUF4139 domain-containing protein [Pseudomonadota bacterium]